METAVAYIRVSSQRQVDEGGSLETQTKQVQAFAESNRYKLVKVFREEGESAKTDQRPRLQEMLQFCRDRRNQVSLVLVPKIDRLARNVNDYSNLKLQLNRMRVRLESLSERLDDTPAGRFTETILASVAQFDNEIRAERSKNGMLDAISEGRWVWKAPLGYRNVRVGGKGSIEPDPEKSPIVREAFQMLATGQQSIDAVHSYLAFQGVKISRAGLYKLVRSEVYLGRIAAFGKTYQARSPFVPLIDRTTFALAQNALRPTEHPQQYQMNSPDFPLRGSMLCQCGHRFTASWSRGEQGVLYGYYRCMHCKRPSQSMKVVETFFEKYLGSFRGNELGWNRLKSILIDQEVRAIKSFRRRKEETTAHIQKLEKQQEAIIQKNIAGVIEDDLAKRQLEKLSAEISYAVREIPPDTPLGAEELVKFARRFFTDLRFAWADFSLETKKNLLHFMFPEGILFNPESGFRTPRNSLSERIQKTISGDISTLVDPRSEFSNSLHKWLRNFYLEFHDDFRSSRNC